MFSVDAVEPGATLASDATWDGLVVMPASPPDDDDIDGMPLFRGALIAALIAAPLWGLLAWLML
jgi:hypothetical protein